MSPSALLGDRAPSCMLYSMVECRAWGSRTHPWPCWAMPGNSVQRRCAPRREGKEASKFQCAAACCSMRQNPPPCCAMLRHAATCFKTPANGHQKQVLHHAAVGGPCTCFSRSVHTLPPLWGGDMQGHPCEDCHCNRPEVYSLCSFTLSDKAVEANTARCSLCRS